MLLKKFFFSLIFLFLNFTMVFLNFDSFYSLGFKYFDINLDSLNNYNFLLFNDKNSMIFIFMVCLVTCLVSLYSEVYMEHYNNKKFFFLMFLFFSFMSLLSFSGSFILFMLGWDGLGLSSIALIMFYPNKNTLYNSILTMIFNRLGDVILIFILCKFLQSYSSIFFLSTNFSFTIAFLVMICGFTKSAQFPLSSWLPAAMSAPTPISAMVHSSTLVTAGILTTQFFFFYFKNFNLMDYMMLFCLLTFILGGFMGIFELDQKKVIAFSTMSQISMILFFCTINMIGTSLLHMLFHAFFKTLLFVSAGIMFINFFSKQMKNFMSSGATNFLFLNTFLFLSVYSMSGLTFSSSFFSKDILLEIMSSNNNFFLFFALLMGSVLTIFYSCKLLNASINFMSFNKIFYDKMFYFSFSLIFIFFVSYSGQIYKMFFMVENFPNLMKLDLLIIYVFLLFPLVLNLSLNKFSVGKACMLNLIVDVFLMKYFTFSSINSIKNIFNMEMMMVNDSMIFKTFYLNVTKENLKKFNFNSDIYITLSILFLMLMLN